MEINKAYTIKDIFLIMFLDDYVKVEILLM